MKNLLTFLLLSSALTINAQQVNGDFDQAWVNCKPYTGGTTTTIGTQPQGWTISHIAGMNFIGWMGSTSVANQVTGYNNTGYAVELKNSPNSISKSNIVPSYITLGTTWNTAIGTSAKNPDGGTFGGKSFTYRPDGIKFHYKRSATNSEPASVIAYLWSGTWSQENVPVNVAMSTPTKVTMIDRDRNILDIICSEGGTVTSNNGKLIALINENITETPSEWEEYFVKFDYKDQNQIPEKINIILAANDYFGVASAVTKDNTLTIDNVTLVYYNTLSDLSYEGHVLNFNENTFNYDLSDIEYEENKLSYTKKAIGGNVKKEFNKGNGILTLTVTGDDGNYSTYTIKFKKPYSGEISSISYNGTPIPDFTQGTNHYYSVIGEYSEGCISATTADEGLSASVSYNAATRIATISVPESGKDIKYYVKFAQETTSYNSKLVISMNNGFLSAPAQGVGISAIRDGKVDLQLSNFEFYGTVLGDIYVHDIAIDEKGNISKTDIVSIFGENGSTLGDLPIELSGNVSENELTCNLDITWMGNPIVVSVYPISTPYIIATGISNADVAAIKAGLTNPNCLIYADDNSNNIENVIANGVCASLNINDGYDIEVPQAFSANKITLNRTFPAGWSTVCLPFATTATAFGTDVKAQAFTSADANGLNFTGVTALESNKPYLIYFPSATEAPIYMSAEVSSTTPEAVTYGDFTFCGSYAASISMTGKYGVADQGDVQKLMLGGANSTLGATRAYFTKKGAQPAEINLNLWGDATGIDAVTNDAETFNVYNLQGVMVRQNVNTLNGLQKGIYIVNGKKVSVK